MLSFSVLGKVFDLSGKKIYEWYRNVLSNFTDEKEQHALHEHDTKDKSLIDKVSKTFKKIFVPILKLENFGKNMTMDDKNVGGEAYTIFSNKDTGKIALMLSTTKASIIMEVLQKIPVTVRLGVETMSKDLADGYDWVSRSMFLRAMRIADKFHVIQLAMQALQDIRVRYRQEILSEERKSKKDAWGEGKKYRSPQEKRYKNGETVKEVLARSRYLLFRFKSQWTEAQEERALILFELFPEIKKAYTLICSFRSFYNCSVGNGKMQKARKSLNKWYRKLAGVDIPEIQNFVCTVKKHEPDILAYFSEGHTNAFAESLNNKIQRFVQSNYGIRDRDFFHFRLKQYFS